MRPSVLWITRWYPNRLDDQDGNFIENHARATSLFADVVILYIGGDPNLNNPTYDVQHTIEYGLSVYRIYYRNNDHSKNVIGRFFKFRRYLKACFMGWKLVVRNHGLPQIIHMNILTRPFFITYWASLKYKIPFLITEHSSYYLTESMSWYERFHIVRKFACRRAVVVTTVSKRLQDAMKRFGIRANYRVIPNNVFFSTNSVHHPDTGLCITTIGVESDKRKNVSGLIHAFATVQEQLPEATLQIIGYGPDTESLKALAASLNLFNRKIFFLGKVDNPDVYGILCDSAFVVVNSFFETFSLAAAESLACGTPVLSTRCGGPEEFIDENNGKLIDPGDSKQLAEGLIWMGRHYLDFDRNRIRSQARELFSEEAVGRKFYEIYLSALHIQPDKSS